MAGRNPCFSRVEIYSGWAPGDLVSPDTEKNLAPGVGKGDLSRIRIVRGVFEHGAKS
jgi:hypothetical protein